MIGIDYPTITIGDRVLVVRLSLATQILLRRQGLDPRQLKDMLTNTTDADGKPVENPLILDNLLKVFAACVAENFIDGSPNRFSLDAAPTADYWATQIAPYQIPDIGRVIAEAVGKAAEAAKNRPAPTPNLALVG